MYLLKGLIIALIKLYQKVISPILGDCCCFYPSCSNYTLQALDKHGLAKGLWLSCKRLIRCHPGSECGIDEVP